MEGGGGRECWGRGATVSCTGFREREGGYHQLHSGERERESGDVVWLCVCVWGGGYLQLHKI